MEPPVRLRLYPIYLVDALTFLSRDELEVLRVVSRRLNNTIVSETEGGKLPSRKCLTSFSMWMFPDEATLKADIAVDAGRLLPEGTRWSEWTDDDEVPSEDPTMASLASQLIFNGAPPDSRFLFALADNGIDAQRCIYFAVRNELSAQSATRLIRFAQDVTDNYYFLFLNLPHSGAVAFAEQCGEFNPALAKAIGARRHKGRPTGWILAKQLGRAHQHLIGSASLCALLRQIAVLDIIELRWEDEQAERILRLIVSYGRHACHRVAINFSSPISLYAGIMEVAVDKILDFFLPSLPDLSEMVPEVILNCNGLRSRPTQLPQSSAIIKSEERISGLFGGGHFRVYQERVYPIRSAEKQRGRRRLDVHMHSWTRTGRKEWEKVNTITKVVLRVVVDK